MPAFYSRIYSLRYGEDAIDVYHDQSECQIAQKILGDHNEVLGQGGRRHCAECQKYAAVY